MKIILFEDFLQDTPSSITERYAGSVRTLEGSEIAGYPMFKPSGEASYIQTQVQEDFKVFHVYLEFDDNGVTSARDPNMLFFIFGAFSLGTYGGSGLRIMDGNGNAAIRISDMEVPSTELKSLYVVRDLEAGTLTVLVNGEPKVIQEAVPDWTPIRTDTYGGRILAGPSGTSTTVPKLPNFLKRFVLASDDPGGKMLDISSLAFRVSDLGFENPVDMNFSGTGYVEDVTKNDPHVLAPSVYSEDTGSIDYIWTKDSNTLGTQLYVACRSEDAKALYVSGVPHLPGRQQEVSPVISTQDAKASVSVLTPVPLILTLAVTASNSMFSPRFTGGRGITIDWGDATPITVADTETRADHVYVSPGTYEVKISGLCETITLASPDIVSVQDWGDLRFKNFAFYKPSSSGDPAIQSLKLVSVPDWLPPSVTTLYYSFAYCRAFDDPSIDLWNVENVRSINRAFGNSGLKVRLGPWVTTALQDMNNAFSGTSFNGPIEDWYVGKVEDMTATFASNPAFNRNLTKWCVIKIPSEPAQFAASAPLLTPDKRPIWGTCPVPA